MQTKYLSIYRYIKNPEIDKAQNRSFPNLRGTWLPSLDWQTGKIFGIWRNKAGIAINWLGIRVRISK